MRLYDLTEQYRDLLEMAQEGGEGVDYAAMLEGMEGAISDKLDGYCKVIRTLEAEAEAVANESTRLAQRKTSLENEAKRMKDAIKVNMMRIGMDKHKSPMFTVSVTKPRERVEVLNIKAVPLEFKTKPEPTVNKKAIMDAWKAGKKVRGVTIVQGELGLMIR
ncbi:siphovirus Gp157 family protein [Paenibacillus alvei]|uniref:siphovirus Gp157 family protein n=1 Tax=Paenibacillus alvei TaxID=44250 RepID=UPI000289D293|nr:siphovirus Gp157 family protein [Paenibacillus alvei]EJW14841.1 putative phage protein [Paenibacillus alvei DSM 29]MCY9543707.1 siphovirus Gp157 family protein [Paenibacillus alvei]MCY9708545.1 siphovirus Gp157 family protein [Paenibacillus alvei]MEC0083246.1 siphovirus Gp157 family protein [Paenibacillus alvei]